VRRMYRPLALAAVAGLGAGILLVGVATLSERPDVPFSSAVIGALVILWGAGFATFSPGKRRR
jgi:hypothetical protein